jgi:hypothetical protein
MTLDSVHRDLMAFDNITDHRTASSGDLATSHWLSAACTDAGSQANLLEYPFARRTVTRASITLPDGREIEGLPLFDSPDTPAGGTTGSAVALGTSGTIGVCRFAPQDGHPLTRRLHSARSNSQHQVIVAISAAADVMPGLAVLNAEHYGAPFGPPVLQIASHAGADIDDAVGSNKPLTVRIESRWESVNATNVDLTIHGRDKSAAPIVIMTPKSGWWTCTSERGGGIAVWLACMRRFSDAPPRRTVHFTANSGHELGHLGMRRYLNSHQHLLSEAQFWVHLGANFASLDSRLLIQADHANRLALLAGALARHGMSDHDVLPDGARPLGEARDIHDGRGRYLSLLGSNRWFHHPDDRLQSSVDPGRIAAIVDAFIDCLDAAANA